jgi:hypothetical protein
MTTHFVIVGFILIGLAFCTPAVAAAWEVHMSAKRSRPMTKPRKDAPPESIPQALSPHLRAASFAGPSHSQHKPPKSAGPSIQ